MRTFNAWVERAVRRALDSIAAEAPRPSRPPVGYNPTEEIRGALLHWVPVPFTGRPVWMELRCLNSTQLEACGGLSLLDVMREKKEPTRDDFIDMRNKQESIIRDVCNRPSFDDIVQELTGADFVAARKREELKKIRSDVEAGNFPPALRKELEAEADRIELSIAFVLPEDAMGFLTSWALGVDVSDIKRLSRDKLLEAAILANNGHNDPHDHIVGVFTDRDRGDIDRAAWAVYNEYVRDKEIEKGAKLRWIKSGRG